jgi:hypothetical protein
MSDIITIDDLNSYMNKDLTAAVAQQVVDAVNAYIESKTGRCWGETKTATERYDGSRSIWLRHQDVISITSIKTGYPGQAQDTYDPAGYYVNSLGRLTFNSSPSGFYAGRSSGAAYGDWLEATYVYGVAEVPEDLKLAALGIAAGFYNWATTEQKEIVSAQVGSYRVNYAGSSTSGTTGTTSDTNWAVINSYATKRF